MQEYSWTEKTAAWAVHAFTASGIIPGFFAIVAISENNFLMAFTCLFISLIIDGVDGSFARKFKVMEVLPNISGKMMDCVIDFATYAIIPAYLIYAAPEVLPQDNYLRGFAAAVILLVSTLYYGKEGMISRDYYFVGFPVMWNLVAFYLYYVCTFSPWVNFGLVIIFAILHFVPIKYLYPSRTKKFQGLNITATVVMILSCFALLLCVEKFIEAPQFIFPLQIIAVISLLYFGALSVYHTYFDQETKGI